MSPPPGGDVVTYQLLRERHLLELHLVDAGDGGRGQRTRGEENSRLHDGSERCMVMGNALEECSGEMMGKRMVPGARLG
jgi:hypothetical protein